MLLFLIKKNKQNTFCLADYNMTVPTFGTLAYCCTIHAKAIISCRGKLFWKNYYIN